MGKRAKERESSRREEERKEPMYTIRSMDRWRRTTADKYFENRDEALVYGGREVQQGRIVFLLREMGSGVFEIEKEIV
ncbi:MAG: hypothetical protein Q4C60_02080 [Eubacteriales bacterium]|nr:hypothetical protein [Eubacteriales bacterium]